ncbi:MAG TPA: Ger(x)C family spore germination protein [Bacillales bacterium]|nr:Ger(x)C family spore germination protein [Bacillales bacterium]
MIKRGMLGILCCSLLMLTGCWDRIEIEDRGFVTAIGIDLAETGSGGKDPVYAVMSQLVVPTAVGKNQSQSGKTKPFFNLTGKGESIFKAIRSLSSKTSRTPFYEHNKLIIFSEQLAKKGDLESVLDLLLRDPESRRSSTVLISKGRASEVLSVKPPNEKLPSMYIGSMSRNHFKNLSMYPPVKIGDIHKLMLLGQSFALPMIEKVSSDQLKMAGAAVIHGENMKMVGTLSPKETRGLKLLTGMAKDGVLKVRIQGKLVVIEMISETQSVQVDLQDKQSPEFKITLHIKGQLAESHLHRDHLQNKVLSTIERKVEKRVKQLASLAVYKVQKQFKTDVIGLDQHMRNYNFDYYQQVRRNWDSGQNIFANSQIKVIPKAEITGIGIINQSSNYNEVR